MGLDVFVIHTVNVRSNERLPRLPGEVHFLLAQIQQHFLAMRQLGYEHALRLIERLLRTVHHNAREFHARRL